MKMCEGIYLEVLGAGLRSTGCWIKKYWVLDLEMMGAGGRGAEATVLLG